jgi:hypothetical protein
VSLVIRAPVVALVDRCVTLGRSSPAACFSIECSFAGPSDWVPMWGNFMPFPRVSVGHVPGLWRLAVAFTCGLTSPDVQSNIPLVMGV